MGKKSKLKAKSRRLEKKRAIKAANKAKYEELRRLGQNSKSKRYTKNSKKNKKINPFDHPDGKCGNIACKKCDPNNIHRKAA